jgi:hypothetical protein
LVVRKIEAGLTGVAVEPVGLVKLGSVAVTCDFVRRQVVGSDNDPGHERLAGVPAATASCRAMRLTPSSRSVVNEHAA